MSDPYDAVVVGAGPAGLTAALYLARYRRSVLVLHDGTSRALRIPRTHNAPGFPGGVRGEKLIRRMTRQARDYGAEVREARVSSISPQPDGSFAVSAGSMGIVARTVILATGIELNEVALPPGQHDRAVRDHVLRYCPICDGFEATGRRVAVLGSDAHGAAEALFLRQFTDDVSLLPHSDCELTSAERAKLLAAGVTVIDTPVTELRPGRRAMTVALADGTRADFDILYPALGCAPRNALAAGMGLTLDDTGCLVTDKDQKTGIPGLFAAGDVVDALDQISVAMGHGAVAATKAHNHLRELDDETLA